MTSDIQTNQLYLADSLLKMQPAFFQRFEKVLNGCGIPFQFLPNTKDIWAVDYMPVQISKDKFVQFTYTPDYLTEDYQKNISDVDSICKAINLKTTKSKLIVDGGNITRTKDKVIMCDKVFHENEHISERNLIRQLKDLFEVDKLFFVPWDTTDYIGHVDGMVRFIDNDTVLINAYTTENEELQLSLRMALHNAGLDWIELPYTLPKDKDSDSAKGLYINFLQMKQAIIVPIFGSNEDEKAVKIFEQNFKGYRIETVLSNEVADEGGILNCISWNIEV